jgi:GH24 family phage-related lysozyme (muramidase)
MTNAAPITLEQLFRFYKALPHQMAAIQTLEKDLALNGYTAAMRRDRAWFATWSQDGRQQDLGAALKLIQRFEGCHLDAYKCPAGVWTIGWGNTRYQDGRPVKQGDKINRIEADMLLRQEVDRIAAKLAKDVPGWREMADEQRCALVSFAYNLGAGFYGAEGFETISKRLKEKDWARVPEAMRASSAAARPRAHSGAKGCRSSRRPVPTRSSHPIRSAPGCRRTSRSVSLRWARRCGVSSISTRWIPRPNWRPFWSACGWLLAANASRSHPAIGRRRSTAQLAAPADLSTFTTRPASVQWTSTLTAPTSTRCRPGAIKTGRSASATARPKGLSIVGSARAGLASDGCIRASMIIPDHEIARLCRQAAMVVPYNADLQNPASLDVLLGDRLMIEVEDRP